MNKIIPTVGRKVWYYPMTGLLNEDETMLKNVVDGVIQPLDATVIAVFADDVVNVSIFDIHGHLFCRRNVKLVNEGERAPSMGGYVAWMPYQVKQAKKDEPLVGWPPAGPLVVIHDPAKDAAKALGELSPYDLERLEALCKKMKFSRPTDLGFFNVPVTQDDVYAARVRWCTEPFEAPAAKQPPVDNAHVAEGCEKFNTPPSPMAAYSLDELRRAWDSIVTLEMNVILMDDTKPATQEDIHAELNRRGEGAYCAV